MYVMPAIIVMPTVCDAPAKVEAGVDSFIERRIRQDASWKV